MFTKAKHPFYQVAVCDTGNVSEASPLPKSVRGVKPKAQRPRKFSTDEKNPDRPHLSSAGNHCVWKSLRPVKGPPVR